MKGIVLAENSRYSYIYIPNDLKFFLTHFGDDSHFEINFSYEVQLQQNKLAQDL